MPSNLLDRGSFISVPQENKQKKQNNDDDDGNTNNNNNNNNNVENYNIIINVFGGEGSPVLDAEDARC